ncbi:uncharacterized protein [Spinacia oleracea]|uniref:SNF2 N-terminal domain-containing protein n=1 Tax=Spinacia oleracea TaxID=3562 RepID=A0ABM3REE7_SPIOL|nr:uncharacterized protein LOC130468943 [Spinacia oleracea]
MLVEYYGVIQNNYASQNFSSRAQLPFSSLSFPCVAPSKKKPFLRHQSSFLIESSLVLASSPVAGGSLFSPPLQVVIADESHYLKNAQAKRTFASLPVIEKAQYAIEIRINMNLAQSV